MHILSSYYFWEEKKPDGEERAGYFIVFEFLMSCDNQCSVALPHGAVGWSEVFDCGIV